MSILYQVPTVSPRVPPDCDPPVRLIAREGFELYGGVLETLIILLKICRFQKEPDAPAALFADRRDLAISNVAGEQDFGLSVRRGDPDPSFAIAEIGVLAACEANVAKEFERRVVVRHQKRDQRKTDGHGPRFPGRSRLRGGLQPRREQAIPVRRSQPGFGLLRSPSNTIAPQVILASTPPSLPEPPQGAPSQRPRRLRASTRAASPCRVRHAGRRLI